jgi:hypothetical protein
MAAADILATTGGLPPSAFLLSEQNDFSSAPALLGDNTLNASITEQFIPFHQFLGLENDLEWNCDCADCAARDCGTQDFSAHFQHFEFPENLNGGYGQLVDSWADSSLPTGTPPLNPGLTSTPPHCVDMPNAPRLQTFEISSPGTLTSILREHPSAVREEGIIEHPAKSIKITVASKAVPAEKKAGRRRFSMPKFTKAALEESFRLEAYPDKLEVSSIAKTAKMSVKQVKTWFSNKRGRTRPEGLCST